MTITQSSTRLVAVAAGVTVALALLLGASMPVRAAALSQTQIQSILNLLTSFGADSATLANVQGALNGQATTGTTGGSTMMSGGVCPFTWSRNLQAGSNGADIKALQQFLNKDSSTMVNASGAGSAGMETMTFGPATKKAVMKFQAKYGISQVGNVGPMTRAKLNSLCTAVTVTPTPTTPVTPVTPTPGVPTPVGTAAVSAGVQPANGVAPINASRVPFTAFTVTAGAAPVTLNSVAVMRQGPSVDIDFAGVVLIDTSTGAQLGIARTLDSNHNATIGSPVVIAAGTSKTFLVAGNMASAAGSGDIASFSVVAVNTTATVSGSLPIIGASNTVNSQLAIGIATIQTSSYDPNNASTQPIGSTGYRFTGFRIQAGSVEDTSFKSITWYQSGSAAGIQNVMTVINGTTYPTTMDVTGRYYTTVFPAPIVITKGNSVDVYVQGDLGANTTSNTYAEFDVYRNTDIYLTGNTYGFGITPTVASTGPYISGSSHNTVFVGGTNTPWLQGSTVTVTAGTFSTIQNATTVGAQNIAVNVAGQTLGGFQTNLTGEAITVQTLPVTFTFSSTTSPLTNVSLVNSSGAVVSGPYNAVCGIGTTVLGTACAGLTQIVTFSGSTLFPTGSNVYTIKGQVPSNTVNGVTIQASTNPSGWTNVTGNTTGNTVTPTVTMFTMNTMTVKAASLTVGNATTPTSQTIVAGGNNVIFASIQLDATQSGEDIRLSSLPLTLVTTAVGDPAKLSACQVWNGTTALNTGTRVVNSTNFTAATSQTVNIGLDNSLVIPKGTTVTLGLSCNVSSSAVAGNTYVFTANATAALYSISGVISGNNLTPVIAGGAGPTMTVSSGATLVVSTDSSSPTYAVAAGGSTGTTLNVLKFRSTNESINLQKVGLSLTGGSNDLTNVYLYAGNNLKDSNGVAIAVNTLIGTASFTGNSLVATSTLNTVVQLPNNLDATILVKGDIAMIGTNQSGTSGDLVKVDYANSEGTGANSGLKIFNATLVGSASNGVRIFKSYPIFTYAAGQTTAATGLNTLLTLTVNAPSNGEVQLYKLTFPYTTTTATFATPTFSGPNGNVASTTNVVDTGSAIVVFFDSSSNTSDRIVAPSTSKTYTLRGNLTLTGNSGANGAINLALGGDAAFANGTAAAISTSKVIWSPDSTSTSALATPDWANSYGLGGCYVLAGLGNACNQVSVSK